MTGKMRSFELLRGTLSEYISAIPAGDRLPTEPLLAQQLGVSRATLREAMRHFEGLGLIRRQQGVGTFVVGHPQVLETGLETLDSITTLARRINLEVFMGDLQVLRQEASSEQAEALDLPAGETVTVVRRVIRTRERPIAYLVDVLPSGVLDAGELQEFQGSVLDLLLERGVPLSHSRTEILTAAARSEIARSLEIQRGDSLLLFVASLVNPAGRVIDFSQSYFLPGYFRFHVIRRVGVPTPERV